MRDDWFRPAPGGGLTACVLVAGDITVLDGGGLSTRVVWFGVPPAEEDGGGLRTRPLVAFGGGLITRDPVPRRLAGDARPTAGELRPDEGSSALRLGGLNMLAGGRTTLLAGGINSVPTAELARDVGRLEFDAEPTPTLPGLLAGSARILPRKLTAVGLLVALAPPEAGIGVSKPLGLVVLVLDPEVGRLAKTAFLSLVVNWTSEAENWPTTPSQ